MSIHFTNRMVIVELFSTSTTQCSNIHSALSSRFMSVYVFTLGSSWQALSNNPNFFSQLYKQVTTILYSDRVRCTRHDVSGIWHCKTLWVPRLISLLSYGGLCITVVRLYGLSRNIKYMSETELHFLNYSGSVLMTCFIELPILEQIFEIATGFQSIARMYE
jgi:hypothetical protein